MKLISVLLGSTLAASTLLMAGSAQAAPQARPVVSQAAASQTPYKRTVHISGARHNDFNLAIKFSKAGGVKGTHLDWRKAKSVFGKHTTLRDKLAGGFQDAGGTLDHASQSTKSRLAELVWAEQAKVAGAPTSAKAKAVPGVAAGGGTNCSGESKYVPMNDAKPRPYATQYYNSCETNIFKRNMGLCMIAVGALTLFGGAWVKAPGTIIASTCGAWREELQLKQSNSKVNAVKYRYYRGAAHPDGSYDQDMWIYSQ